MENPSFFVIYGSHFQNISRYSKVKNGCTALKKISNSFLNK